MENSKINFSLSVLAVIFLSLGLFYSCDRNPTPTEPNQISEGNIDKDTGEKTPTTDVHGYVTLNSSPYSGMKVTLRKGTTVLTHTYSDSTGFYTICVCNQFAGTGTYSVKTEIITIKGENYQGMASFYWDDEVGPWEFIKNLQIVKITSK